MDKRFNHLLCTVCVCEWLTNHIWNGVMTTTDDRRPTTMTKSGMVYILFSTYFLYFFSRSPVETTKLNLFDNKNVAKKKPCQKKGEHGRRQWRKKKQQLYWYFSLFLLYVRYLLCYLSSIYSAFPIFCWCPHFRFFGGILFSFIACLLCLCHGMYAKGTVVSSA